MYPDTFGKLKLLGVASNIFNFTLEFNEKHFNPQFFPCYKQKKQQENFSGELW